MGSQPAPPLLRCAQLVVKVSTLAFGVGPPYPSGRHYFRVRGTRGHGGTTWQGRKWLAEAAKQGKKWPAEAASGEAPMPKRHVCLPRLP